MESALEIINSITMLDIVKVMIIVLVVVYNVFAFLMLKMASSMTRSVQIKDGVIVNTLALAHFIFAVIVLILSIVVL